MTRYAIEVTARKACGCEVSLDFNLEDDELEPDAPDVAAVLFCALDPEEETGMLDFLMTRDAHAPHGCEKITVTAELKVRS